MNRNKIKLLVYRTLLWGGLVLFCYGMLSSGGGWTPGFVMQILGIVCAIIGAAGLDRHYRCPKCGQRLLGVGHAGIAALVERLPGHCTRCGWEVDEGYFR